MPATLGKYHTSCEGTHTSSSFFESLRCQSQVFVVVDVTQADVRSGGMLSWVKAIHSVSRRLWTLSTHRIVSCLPRNSYGLSLQQAGEDPVKSCTFVACVF